MNKTVFEDVIYASKAKAWDVLFNQYGEIHIHNPTMQSSNYMNGASKGELGCVRHCQFSDKLFLDEKIVDVKDGEAITIVVEKHNLPFVKEMKATYELTSISENETKTDDGRLTTHSRPVSSNI